MTKKRIVIKQGEVIGFADEVSFEGLTLESYDKKRVSRIVPTNYWLMLLFCALRAICTDESKLAKWTREWSCNWKVIIDDEQFGPFKDRSIAIDFEKEKIYGQGKLKL
ncbi:MULTISPECIES: hypothetical protein [Vibrio]|uniref:Uncharacterized protein n=1 Tax=Vibrio splendidus TaxID=29497 RepID=A0A2T5EJP8_VIBSP|nr:MULTISPECIES: hypothetical protein [Vibrio]EHY9845546.1 hypothetical protein [Vibrio cholerae]MCS0096620.1 hypothetical protein [Vibrio cholerae]NOI05828.1 hypothetical protein [Vibrio anguillarum]OCQ08680.1 hypothetical protein AKH09_10950 [Vibrio parahaemolyticus]OEE57290.1 hypothetical protein A147_05130 [Vibrio splendidus FF-6]